MYYAELRKTISKISLNGRRLDESVNRGLDHKIEGYLEVIEKENDKLKDIIQKIKYEEANN